MVECTRLFPGAEWAAAYVEDSDRVRIALHFHNDQRMIHMRISEFDSFIERVKNLRPSGTQSFSDMRYPGDASSQQSQA